MRQRGFTLVELLVALAIGSVVLTGSLLTFEQVFSGTIRARNQTIAVNDVNFAAARIKRDIEMAQTTNLTDAVPQTSVTLTWIDYSQFASENVTPHSSTYTLSGTQLLRNYDGTVSIIGRNTTSIGFTLNGRVITTSITATGVSVQQRSKTLVFSMRMRTVELQ